MAAVSSNASAKFGFPRSLRIIKSSDYGVIVHARNANCMRMTSRYFSLNAFKHTEFPGRLRIGITVGKKNAHRSVDRALVKRILREAARTQAPTLFAQLREMDLGLDVSLRLKKPLKTVPGRDVGVNALKKSLNEDVARLMMELNKRLERLNSHDRNP